MKKEPKDKIFTVTDVELSEYSFYAQLIKQKEMEHTYWSINLDDIRQRIKKRIGLEKENTVIHWDEIFSTSKIRVTVLPQPEVKGDNAKQELHQEQSEGIPSTE